MATLEEALQQAAASRDAGNPDVAENVYRAILAKFPQNEEAREGLNDLLAAQGKAGAPTNLLEESELQALLALYDGGQLAETVERATALIERYPSILVLYNVLGAVLLDQNEDARAIDCFHKALALEPNAAEGYNNLGIALHRIGSHEEAIERFSKAIELDLNYPDAHKNLGALYADQGRIEEAIAAMRSGDPDNRDPDSSALLLECFLRQGNKTAFDIQAQFIKSKQEAINIRACAAAAFAAQQYGSQNVYDFCPDAITKIGRFDLAVDGQLDTAFTVECANAIGTLDAIETCTANLQGPAAFLERNSDKRWQALDAAVRRCVEKYRTKHENDESLFISAWPREFAVAARPIRPSEMAEAVAHVHRSWMSGFLCLGTGASDGVKDGAVEFTLRGYDLPVLREEYPCETTEIGPGSCVLFPSSLPHRVIDLPKDGSAVFLALDIVPD
jgi:hypothetical protein